MPIPLLLFLAWFLIVTVTAVVKISQFRAKGQTLQEALQAAAAKAAAQPRRQTPPPSTGSYAFFGFVGALFMVGALWAALSTQRFIQTAARAPGQIYDFKVTRSSKGGYSYAPCVQFAVPSGRMIIYTAHLSANHYFWPRIGSWVDVYYDPSFPTNARIDCFADLWLGSAIIFFFGAIFLGISILTARQCKRNPPTTSPPPAPMTAALPSSASPSHYNFPNIIR